MGNALQSVLFTVIWRGLAERKNHNEQRQQQETHEASRRSLQEEEDAVEVSMEETKVEDTMDVPIEEEQF